MTISRRKLAFAAGAAATTSLFYGCKTAAPQKKARLVAPGQKVRMAYIGIGGRGAGLSQSFDATGEVHVVALCDVAMGTKHTARIESLHPDAPRFHDFRLMFDEIGNQIDAVMVATPDHSHFPACMMAMALGKHVYVEKPMARTFQEVELMMAAAEKYGVVTQMGNQGHSGSNYFQFKMWKDAGVIKDVTHVTAFMNKSRRWHGWGNVTGYPEGMPVPEHLDWDLWKSVSPVPVEYNPALHPGNWRGWYSFGTGCFGDWGAHILDTIHEFLDLGLPQNITAKKLDGPNRFIYPMGSTINFDFPARGNMPAMDIDWYDGRDNLPPVPEEYGKELNPDTPGKFIFSKEYTFYGESHSSTLSILPYEKMRELLKSGDISKDYGKHSDHSLNFVRACRGEEQTRSPFSIAGPLSQTLTLGCLAQRLGGSLRFDRVSKRITNNPAANMLLAGPPPRPGWEQFYKH